MYSCGLGAVSSGAYSNLHALVHARISDPRQPAATTTIIESLFSGFSDATDAFKTLPGHESNYVPVSEYVFKDLQPLADDVLFLGADYEQQFDRLEVLIFLESGGWAPVGRFGWKHRVACRGGRSTPSSRRRRQPEMIGANPGKFFLGLD